MTIPSLQATADIEYTMTLLERIEAPATGQNLDQRLIDAFSGVQGRVGMGIDHGPTGTRALLVIDAMGDRFFDAELHAMEQLLSVRRDFPIEPIDLLCLSTKDAAAFDLPSRTAIYSFD